MWRLVMVIAFVGATTTGADARSFRFSFGPRGSAASRSLMLLVKRKTSPAVPYRKDGETRPSDPSGAPSVPHVPGPVVLTPVPTDQKAALEKKAAERAAHWCDNGKIVGSGTGFCVLNVSTGASS